jgi:hypothetical protein
MIFSSPFFVPIDLGGWDFGRKQKQRNRPLWPVSLLAPRKSALPWSGKRSDHAQSADYRHHNLNKDCRNCPIFLLNFTLVEIL